jgi:hypothetical protein
MESACSARSVLVFRSRGGALLSLTESGPVAELAVASFGRDPVPVVVPVEERNQAKLLEAE